MNGRSRWVIPALALALAGTAACKKNEPPPPAPPPPVAPERAPTAEIKVTEIQLGNALGADKRIAEPKTSFATKDMIFASVVTEGGGAPAEIGAKWTFQDGQVVSDTKKSITPAGREVHEFSIQKPDGWPAGSYKVEISLNGKAVDSKTFTVQ